MGPRHVVRGLLLEDPVCFTRGPLGPYVAGCNSKWQARPELLAVHQSAIDSDRGWRPGNSTVCIITVLLPCSGLINGGVVKSSGGGGQGILMT